MGLSQRAGWFLMGIGAIHCLIGMALGWNIWVEWHASGWWHSIETQQGIQMDRFGALWFQISGISWLMMGWLMQQWLKQLGSLPSALGWALMAMGLLVAFVLPLSGAWLFLPLGWLIARAPRHATPNEPALSV